MLLLAKHDRRLQERLTRELAEVETRFSAELLSDLPCVNSLVTHVERYRGKMLRPMLVLVAGLSTQRVPDQPLTEAHRAVATVVEMVHMATLVHDDILDEAQVRRRGLTINSLQGNETAVMLGDYLISHAYHLCSTLESQAIARRIAQATNTVCEGELLQLANRNNLELDEDTYYEIIRRKTASLCGACCELAAILNDAPEPIAQGLYNYGEHLGQAFQIVDDVLDLVGTEEKVGKTLGRDLAKGKLTLPMIHGLSARSDAAQRGRLLELLQSLSASQDTASVGLIRDLLVRSHSVAYAQQQASQWVQKARHALSPLEDGPAKMLLLDLADQVLTRQA